MSTSYIEVPINDITNLMVFRSTSTKLKDMPQVTHTGLVYYVLEFDSPQINLTNIYDIYTWYTATQIKDRIANP